MAGAQLMDHMLRNKFIYILIHLCIMDTYIKNYNTYKKTIIYDFNLGSGGIGDLIKFFMYILNKCFRNNVQLKYKINNIIVEKYLLLKNKQMYITSNEIIPKNLKKYIDIEQIDEGDYIIVTPFDYYKTFNYEEMCTIPFEDVFIFSNEVISNSLKIIDFVPSNYISFHLRVGDKYLETDNRFIVCKNDVRSYNEDNIFKTINDNSSNSIIFFCDNKQYKLKIKSIFKNILITNCDIGHTSLYNTTEQQILDTITEFYLLCNSEKIFSCSESGFSIIASKFKNIKNILLYK